MHKLILGLVLGTVISSAAYAETDGDFRREFTALNQPADEEEMFERFTHLCIANKGNRNQTISAVMAQDIPRAGEGVREIASMGEDGLQDVFLATTGPGAPFTLTVGRMTEDGIACIMYNPMPSGSADFEALGDESPYLSGMQKNEEQSDSNNVLWIGDQSKITVGVNRSDSGIMMIVEAPES